MKFEIQDAKETGEYVKMVEINAKAKDEKSTKITITISEENASSKEAIKFFLEKEYKTEIEGKKEYKIACESGEII